MTNLSDNITRLVQLLSLQSDHSVAHNIQAHQGGVRISYKQLGYQPVYIYALPWSRGFSIFMSHNSKCDVYSWRHVSPRYTKYSVRLTNPRDTCGPEHTHPNRILAALLPATKYLDSIKAKRAAYDHYSATPTHLLHA